MGFCHNQNNRGSSSVIPACTAVCTWRQNTQTPKLSPMAEEAIKRGGIASLVSLVYICGADPGLSHHVQEYCYSIGCKSLLHTTITGLLYTLY